MLSRTALKLAKKINRLIPRWIATVVIILTILYLTLDPEPVNTDDLPIFPGADKIVHAIMFGTLATAILYDWLKHKISVPSTGSLLVIGTLTIGFGAIDEWMQERFTTARSGDPYDLLADAIGVIISLILLNILLRRYATHRPACHD